MPLSRYRVVQTGSGFALDYCGKLFADFGADVIKLEPLGGDPLRSFPPILESGESGVFAWLNTNKRSVTETPEALAALLPGADVLLDGRALTPPAPSVMAGPGRPPTTCEMAANNGIGSALLESIDPLPDAAALRATYPGLSVTTLSWFGETGPYRDFAATEATVRALGGLVALTGRAEGPPTLATDGQSGIIAGLAAFIASAAGLYGRGPGSRRLFGQRSRNRGQHRGIRGGGRLGCRRVAQAPGVNRFGRNYPVGIYPTKHGMIGVTIVTPANGAASAPCWVCPSSPEPALRDQHRPPGTCARDRRAVPARLGNPHRGGMV